MSRKQSLSKDEEDVIFNNKSKRKRDPVDVLDHRISKKPKENEQYTSPPPPATPPPLNPPPPPPPLHQLPVDFRDWSCGDVSQ
jgi:hypothetical protein